MKLNKFILAFAFLTTGIAGSPAQELASLPIDTNVRYGKLPNGLTYYIRHNNQPNDRADFYIAQNVGSMQEEDPQRGLAHFLEHMAFNGTSHYPGKSMLNYLESIGVKFGANVNAYTSLDETVYNLTNVPVREGTIDSCLLILHDWSSQIALEDKEIDNERGVISEEWRTRQNASMRMYDSILPKIYAGSKYAHRMPIGLMDVIQNFSYKELRDYYKKWYRPDLQGIIIVGDIDVDRVEKKVKELFGSIKLPENPAKRVYFPVPDNAKPIIAIAKDKEATNTQIMVFFKHEAESPEVKASAQGIANSYIKSLIAMMINDRFNEITKKPGAPFLGAGAYDGDFFFAKTKDAFTGYISCKEGEAIPAMSAFFQELERVDKYGFTSTEFQRAVANYLQAATDQYMERDKMETKRYVQEYVTHFTSGGSISGIENEYKIIQQLNKTVTLDQVNAFIRNLIKHDNVAVVVMGPDKEGLSYPTEAEILGTFENAARADLKPYDDKVSNEPLVSNLPPAGKIVSEKHDKKFDATVWKLSNGATVFVKPTDFKNDQIVMTATSPGGTSQFSDQDILDAKVVHIGQIGGKGKFSVTELDKVLAGKSASVSTGIQETTETVDGSSTPRDLETMMQLAYLSITSPRKDIEAFEAWKEQAKTSLENQEMNPSSAFSDTLISAIYQNDPRRTRLKSADIDKLNYDNILKLYKERFADASDFTFVFVGNINPDTLKPLVEKYIASLPSLNRKETGKTTERRPGKYENNFKRPMETPKSTVYLSFSGKCKYTYENALKLDILASVMRIVYTRTIREEQGGTYGVGVSGGLTKENDTFSFLYSFDTNDKQEENLKKMAYQELMDVVQKGPEKVDLEKVIGNMLKDYDEYQKQNGYLALKIRSFYTEGKDWNTYKEIVQKQTPETIRAFAQKLFGQKNEIEVTMTGTPK